ncbi:MAG: tRNA (adenosine(37)-N6)-threonylcarbamoyltransferase complex ATPase subunit type 1 TsaE [Alphaproteobacteria bacterium]|nr:tRNA (adenosine(37)-N6)-threonylcarbamoyltransferase complex ATPase subunit type 1 TsaE [Alphaproteobacteria bacterium]
MSKVFKSNSEKDTAYIAEQFADIAKSGDIFALNGTLGAGKSVFARAFIQKLTPVKEAPSPTFTLVQMYPTPKFDIYHYDLYRLKSPAELFELNVDEAFYAGVCLIEWPEKMGPLTPRNIWQVDFEVNGNERTITVSVDDEEKLQRLEHVG